MFIRWKVTSANHLLLPVLVLCGLVGSCAPRLSPPLPPPDYKGPIAEQPIEDSGYVWVYESADGKKGTARNVFGNYYGFPLWVGKWWSYESGSSLEGTELWKVPHNVPVEIFCKVVSFKQITVIAGTFAAFECQCTCGVLIPSGNYDPFCGAWTQWYAPELKNTIRRDDQESHRNWELVDWE